MILAGWNCSWYAISSAVSICWRVRDPASLLTIIAIDLGPVTTWQCQVCGPLLAWPRQPARRCSATSTTVMVCPGLDAPVSSATAIGFTTFGESRQQARSSPRPGWICSRCGRLEWRGASWWRKARCAEQRRGRRSARPDDADDVASRSRPSPSTVLQARLLSAETSNAGDELTVAFTFATRLIRSVKSSTSW